MILKQIESSIVEDVARIIKWLPDKINKVRTQTGNKQTKQTSVCQINPNIFCLPFKADTILVNIDNQTKSMNMEDMILKLLNQTLQIDCGLSDRAKYFCEQSLLLLTQDINLNDLFMDYQEHQYSSHKDHQPKVKKDCELSENNLTFYLQALSEGASSSKQHSQCLLDNGILILFHKIMRKYPQNIQIQRSLFSCLSALSLHQESRWHFHSTGWTKILEQTSSSNNLVLQLESTKALYNLKHSEKLNRSLYILQPVDIVEGFSNERPSECDIIFVHGLKGGVVKTWRQGDAYLRQSNGDDYSQCWPRDWLAPDFPHCRVLAINYDSFLSYWNVTIHSEVETLQNISNKLAQDLIRANVGRKPIIWVTHSMGGLIVKQILVNHLPFFDKTKGIVFFSVPHKGSEMAVWSPKVQRIILPSSHVRELSKGLFIGMARVIQLVLFLLFRQPNFVEFAHCLRGVGSSSQNPDTQFC